MKELVVYVVDKDIDKVIWHFEDEMITKYKEAIKLFVPLFEQNGCSLKLEQWWVNKKHNIWSTIRLPIEKGYECYIYCMVERNGEVVFYNDGEDYDHFLMTSWMISSYIRTGFKKTKINLYASIDDVDSELTDFLSILKQGSI